MSYFVCVRYSFILYIVLFVINLKTYSKHKPSALFYSSIIFAKDTLKLNDGTDPSQPVNRFDLQNNFFWDWMEFKNDRSYNVAQINGGFTFYKSEFYFLLRLPVVTTNVTFENQTGFGDISFAIQYSTSNKNKLNIIAGSEFIFPTGSSNETGTGKFIAGPYAGVIDYFRSGYYGIIITEYFSYAGQSNRNDVKELSINPLLKINLGKNWYTIITPDIRYNFNSTKFFIPYTQEFGKLFIENFAASVKAGIHLKNDKKYDVLAGIKFSFLL